jgi:asparagine synthase (glutamine-hydrolysing)
VCGIAGIVNKGRMAPEQLESLARAMALTMAHRGPDDAGVWVAPDAHVALAHRRLSIIDVSEAGHQPMFSADGRAVITFNGELYNFRELRADMERRGVEFRTHSDTEVLLAALQRFGADALPRLDAMFAFGYYDLHSRELLLARDIFGEKPLYYLETAECLAFASELHALTKLPSFDATISTDAIASYLCFQYVPAPQAIYQSVRKLEPGHWLRVGAEGTLTSGRYFSFVTSSAQTSGRNLDDLADELEAILETSLRRRLISDVPLGAFLSGGVDSTAVAAIARRKLGAELKTFSIGFEGHKDSEHLEAAEIAAHLGTVHKDQVLTANAVELGKHVGSVLDEPNGDTSCLPTFLLSQFARREVTVALSGDGGDELFGGYGRYFNTVDEWTRKKARDPQLAWWQAGAVYVSQRILVFPDDELERVFSVIPGSLRASLLELRNGIDRDSRPLLNVLRELDARHYMPGAVLAKVDRMSMQHSLEVRAPLLGIDVARFAMTLASDDCYRAGQGKRVLKRVASRYVPAEWMARPKRGFGLPMDMWGARQLLPALDALIRTPDCRLAEWIPHANLVRYLDHLRSEFHPYRAWALFVLEHWLRTHPAVPDKTWMPAIEEPPSKLFARIGTQYWPRRWRSL